MTSILLMVRALGGASSRAVGVAGGRDGQTEKADEGSTALTERPPSREERYRLRSTVVLL